MRCEVVFGNRVPSRRGMEKRMSAVLEINVALWGMLICSGMEVAGWLHAAF